LFNNGHIICKIRRILLETAFEKARKGLELNGKFAYGAMPAPIADSWRRCVRLGLDPSSKPEEAVVSHTDLNQRRDKLGLVMQLARPELELLSAQIAGPNFLLAFADSDGVILDRIVDEEFRNSNCGRSIIPGSIWSEAIRGTNALGLSLHSGVPCNVTGPEHFFSKEGQVSCLSAPIFDSSGQLIGLIDASSEVTVRQYHTLALVNLAAQNVENRLFVDDHRGHQIIQFHPRQEYLQTQNVGMIAFNQEGEITGANRRTGELLTGLKLSSTPKYEDVFMGQFRALISRICKGEVVQIKDWLHSGYFARLRLTHNAKSALTKTQFFLPAEPIYHIRPATQSSITGRVFKDETLRYNLRLGKKSAQQGLPVLILGAKGTGKNTIAEELHEQLHADQNFIMVDCSTVDVNSVESQLIAQMKSLPDTSTATPDTIDLNKGGTLYLDRVDLLPTDIAPMLNTLLNRVMQRRSPLLSEGEWIILSSAHTDGVKKVAQGPHNQLIKRLSGFSLFLPNLNHRSDFQHLCSTMLAMISPQHSLSNCAIEALQKSSSINNLSDLDWSIRTLATQHNEGIIRTEGIVRILGHHEFEVTPCPRCSGQMAKEVQCLEIKKMIRECSGNIALAARQLGVSRNTVYAHSID
jgi:transcriptional regulator of acetoin/glycerol metabolism